MAGSPLWAWAITVSLVVALLAADFVLAARRPHVVGLAEATVWSVFYADVAVIFGLVLWLLAGPATGAENLAGWVVEKSLSVDNLFVFLIIMGRFAVPAQYQQKVLLFGIVAALAMRAAFIAVGAAAIEVFTPTFLLFGLLLIWTAIQLVRHRNDDPDPDDNLLLRYARRVLPATADMAGGRLIAPAGGRRVVTPAVHGVRRDRQHRPAVVYDTAAPRCVRSSRRRSSAVLIAGTPHDRAVPGILLRLPVPSGPGKS